MDISSHLFSTDTIKNRIGNIFPDCVVLDCQFKITAISQNILDATGYARPDLLGHSLNIFSNSIDLVSELTKLLKVGFFSDASFEIRRNDGEHIDYVVSGFYLGLVCDLNGLIILRLNNQLEVRAGRDQHDLKTAELDKFIYNAAHSLRGPLATIKGLINVAKTYRHTNDVLFLINQLDDYSEKLDDKLHKLIYFAESDKKQEPSTGKVQLSELVVSLTNNIAESREDQRVNFKCIADDQTMPFSQGQIVLGILRNLLHFFRQHIHTPQNSIVLDVHAGEHCTELIVHANGFLVNQLLKAKLATINNSYSEILNHPELVNYYAVKKIVNRLRGEIQFIISQEDEVTVLILIPDAMVSKP